MSLHAQLSPEALQRLRAQQRNSTLSSIAISVLFIVLLSLVLGLFLLPQIIKETPVVVVYEAADNDEPADERKVKKTINKNPTPTSTSVAKVITSAAQANVAIPVPDIAISPPSVDFGETIEFTQSWGGSQSFASIPSTMRKRCSQADRMQRLQEGGGNINCERAVIKALDWIKATQNEDGSWGTRYPAAMTGFSILAYLGHCETPKSTTYGDSVTRGLTFLIDLGMKNNGKLTTSTLNSNQWVYEHGIATYALAEAQTFSKEMRIKIPNLAEVTQRAGNIIMEGQAPSGGWNYRYSQENNGDNSVGFWQIQALKACKHTGLWQDSKITPVAEKALGFLERVQGANGAIGYRKDSKRSPGLTGGGVLAFQMWGKGNSKAARKGIEYIRNNTQFEWGRPSSNLYYHYYNAQAMINAGGSDWKWYNNLFMDKLLDAQEEDGSWIQNMRHGAINTHMATCLATFMLEVYYRFLPGTNN